MLFHKKRGETPSRFEEIFKKLLLQMETLERASETVYEILKTLVHVLAAEGGSLFIYQPEHKIFSLKKWIGLKPVHLSVSGDYEFVSYLKKVLTPLFRDEILKESRFIDVRSAGTHFFTQLSCHAVVPLVVKGGWIGLLNLGKKIDQERYSEEDRKILSLLGHWLSHHLAASLLYEEIQNQNQKLSDMTRVKTELMANVTHELRTPLNGIIGLADLLLEGADGDLNPDQRRHLQMMKEGGEGLLDIVNNILSLIKIESGRCRIEIKKVELGKMVDEIAGLFEGILINQENRFQSHIPRELVVFGDEDQVRTLLVNLISNAVKFTKKGQIEIHANKSGDMARICVKDTGIGIHDEDQETIFDEFRQGDGSLTRQFGGTGLGLAIAKKIVELHGGRIWVDSVQGKGSEFYFTLPLKPI